MKKKFLALVMVVCLLGVSVVSGTLAYFTDTAEATNVFTVGNVDITLTEVHDVLDGGPEGNPIVGKSVKTATGVTYSNIMPTNYMKKNVIVTNEENPAYVRVVVVLNNADIMNTGIDGWFEAKFAENGNSYTLDGVTYQDSEDLLEKVYDDVFAGWGLTYKHNNADYPAGKDARFVITDAEKPSPLVIDVDTTRTIGTEYYEFGLNNMFGKDNVVQYNPDIPYHSSNVSDGYYSKALNPYEIAFVYYIAMDKGDSVTLFDGLYCPDYFEQENAAFFNNLQIKVYADAIQQEGFTNEDGTPDVTGAFTALNDAHPMTAVRGGDIDKDPTEIIVNNGVETATAEEVLAALAEGKSAILTDDVNLDDAPITIKNSKSVIDLNGHKLTGTSTSSTTSNLIKVNAGAELAIVNGTVSFKATKPDTDWDPEGFPGYANNTLSVSGKLVVKNATIENQTPKGGASYAIDCYPGADVVIEDGAVINGYDKVAIRMFANSNTVPTNVTINGGTIEGHRAIWVQLPGSDPAKAMMANLTITGGKLISNDTEYNDAIYVYSYGNSREKTNVTITGGTFLGDVEFGGGQSKTPRENVIITGGTFTGDVGFYTGEPAPNDWEDYNFDSVPGNNDIETPVAAGNATELSNAISSGASDVLLTTPGTYTLSTGGKEVDVNITGTKDTVIDLTNATGVNGSDITLNGVTVKTASENYKGFQQSGNIEYNDVTFEGSTFLYGEKVVFNECTFNLTSNYIWTYGAEEVEFNKCVFNTDGKAILIYKEAGVFSGTVTVKDCTFNATAPGYAGGFTQQSCAAVEIDSSLIGGTYTVNFEGNNIVDEDFCGLVRIKKGADRNNVILSGAVNTPVVSD